MKPLVSVIVPAHNCASTIVRCVDSLLSQDFTDFEIIVVNDGSDDSTLVTVCEEYRTEAGTTKHFNYEESEVELTIISYDNCRGVSYARNEGIKASRGEWLAFVDSDDYVSSEFLKELYDTALANGADIAWCGYTYVVENEGRQWCVPVDLDRHILGANGFRRCFFSKINGLGSMWSKMYRASMVKDCGVLLEEGRRYGEDWAFNLDISKYASKVAISKECPYFYTYNSKGATCIYERTDVEGKFRSICKLLQLNEEFNLNVDRKVFERYKTSEICESLVQVIVRDDNPTDSLRRICEDETMRMLFDWETSMPVKHKLLWWLLKTGRYEVAVNLAGLVIRTKK